MNRRDLGRTGLEVSEIGFGTWQLGNARDWAPMDDATARRLVHEAVDLGINLFDTAPHYAATNGERLLGEALRGRREKVVLVSKFGHSPDGRRDFSVKALSTSVESSLRRLRTDRLDVLLLHNPDPSVYRADDRLWNALDSAVRQGKILHYGASLDRADEIEACLGHTDSRVIEILFNVLHQDVRRAFPLVREKGCGTIAKVPLDSGWLTGRFDAAARFEGVRSRWTRAEIERRADLVAELGWLTDGGASLAAQALAYVLSYDEVSCAIPGARTLSQLRENARAAGRRLGDGDRRRLERLWSDVTRDGEGPLPW